MPAEVIKQINNEITVQFTVKLTGSMLNMDIYFTQPHPMGGGSINLVKGVGSTWTAC